MPKRTGKANNQQSTVEGNFYRVYYIFLGERQYQQGFIGDVNWNAWIKHPDTKSFSYMPNNQKDMLITLRREKRANGQFWYAFKKLDNKLHKIYVGKAEDLNAEKLNEAATTMHVKITGKEPISVTFARSKQVTQPAPLPEAAPVFLPEYKAEQEHIRFVVRRLADEVELSMLSDERRYVLAMIAAGLHPTPDHKKGIQQRKIARVLMAAGLLAEVTGYTDHRKHAWKLTEAGLRLVRSDKDLRYRVKWWKPDAGEL